MKTQRETMTDEEQYDLAYFFESSLDYLCIAGFDGYFKKVNPAYCKLMGYSLDELKSQPINHFIHPDDRGITSQYRDTIIQGRPLLHFENRYITKQGEVVWLSWTSMPKPEQGLVYAIAKNISHKKKMDEDRNSVLTELSKTNSALKQMTYATSHDIRSPLANINAIFNMMDLSKIKDAETVEILQLIQEAARDIQVKLNHHLDGFIKKGVNNVPIEWISLDTIYKRIHHSLKALITESQAEIDVNFSEVPEVFFNTAYLESIFLNLITNSIKYRRPEAHPVIRIKSQIDQGIHQLIFEDEGLGFDMEKVGDKIFGFNQKFHEHQDSKGIGLYLVYNHVKNLGSSIVVTSQVNQGTRFTISFKNMLS